MLCIVFFFSSRRRHTRYWRDWSSDVCSSDLAAEEDVDAAAGHVRRDRHGALAASLGDDRRLLLVLLRVQDAVLDAAAVEDVEIGRASCRERVEISVVAVSLKKKK